ncbi:hypothetical protein [Kineococcus sp. SYSU DK005]|uniref:hypothetical protein n=1 Tax=Kineococcus sp. SYSU DK005 TaxID=3383126 RepID=UPI003D7E2C11
MLTMSLLTVRCAPAGPAAAFAAVAARAGAARRGATFLSDRPCAVRTGALGCAGAVTALPATLLAAAAGAPAAASCPSPGALWDVPEPGAASTCPALSVKVCTLDVGSGPVAGSVGCSGTASGACFTGASSAVSLA